MARKAFSILGWLAFSAHVIFGAPGCAVDVDGFEIRHANAEQVAAVRAAVDLWCTVGLCAHVGDGASSIDFGTHIRVGSDGGCKQMSDGSSQIAVRGDLTGAPLANVLAHELGHHWGCGESEDEASIMSWVNSDVAHVLTDADVACAQ